MPSSRDDLLASLSLEDKIALLSGTDNWHTAEIDAAGIRPLTMTDGPHGVRADPDSTGRITGPTTAFPTGIGLSSTWDPGLLEQVGQALGEETLAMGCDVLLGPCVNIVRHPLGGRNFESYGEDPYLSGQLATAWINGLQSRGVGASLKHFACNNHETERFRNDIIVDERTLREIYLPHFETAVKQAKPWTVMCSYNRLNGEHASQNRRLLTSILRDEWGFEGLVVSDWGAVHTTVEAVEAGLDLEMPGPARYYGDLLARAAGMWQVEEEVIEQAARRVLGMLEKAGKITAKTQHLPQAQVLGSTLRKEEGREEKEFTAGVNTKEHQVLARKAAEQGAVLLKNKGGLLPLDGKGPLALIGPLAATLPVSGGGSAFTNPPYRVSLLDGLKQAPGVTVRHEPGCKLSLTSPFRTFKEDDELIARAAKLAAECAIAVVCIGCPEKYETEGSDRPSMALPGRQDDLVRAVLAANPRTVVVLFAGAPLELPWLEQAPALLLANYPGLEGGAALARLLLGQANPSGKLTVSWPARLQDSPAYLNGPYPEARQVRYGEGLFVGYRYFDAVDRPARFPFGHGLSYTTFAYGEMKVNHGGTEGTEKKKDSLELRVSVVISVTNSGARAGAEVVQLYVRDVQSSLPRPPKELKGFRKVWLEPGETKEVRFELDGRAFAFYHPQAKGWVVEPGEFELIAGASSQDIRAKKAISF